MKTKTIIASTLIAAMALSTPVLARGTDKDMSDNDIKTNFNSADRNRDGYLSQNEWDNASWYDRNNAFSGADTNKDGRISQAEQRASYDNLKKDRMSHTSSTNDANRTAANNTNPTRTTSN